MQFPYNNNMKDYERYSLSYRATETGQIMDWIRAGQCGCILGLRGSGKSNFIRFLLRSDTQQHYLGQDQVNCIFVLINLLSLTEHSEWAIYEMILNNLLEQLLTIPMADEMILDVRTLHQEMMRVRDVLIAKQAVEHCMALLCQKSTLRLVLLFDEFDAVFRNLPAPLFRCLRAIRDTHKDQISYIVVATHDLAGLRDDLAEEVDHFYRLVSRDPCWLGPYSEADARQMTRYLTSRRALELSEKDTISLFELSGGHAGLLKTILSLLWATGNTAGLTKPTLALTEEFAVERECQKIWGSLSEEEKTTLCLFSKGDPLDEQAFNHLAERGLLRKNKNDIWMIFSSVLTSFVQKQMPPPQMGTYINRTPRVAQLDGQRIENLTELEFELLYYLYNHHGHVRTKNDLIENVYRQQYNFAMDGLSDEMLQALISRLRKKIEPDPQHPRYIITVRREGYKFVLLSEQ